MKVILLQNVENLGRAGEVKTVADGYARNFLIPRGFAKPATIQVLKDIEAQKKLKESEEAKELTKLKAWQETINSLTFETTLKARSETEAYGSIKQEKILEFLMGQGINVSTSDVQQEHPLKTFGEYKIKINLGKNLEAHLKVVIKREPEAMRFRRTTTGKPELKRRKKSPTESQPK
jgi:large subunit ribosomal protein L9